MPSELTQFKPGQSGNPGGRPKEVSIMAEVYKILREPAHEGAKVQKKHMVAATLVNLALAGDMNAVKLIVAYADGQPVAKVEVDADIQVTVQAIRRALELVA